MTQVKFSRRPFDNGFNNLVNDLFSGLPILFNKEFNQSYRKDSIPINVIDKEKSYLLEIVAPGFDKTDFKINVEQDLLTISGEKKIDEQKNTNSDQNEKQIRKEYSYRSFKRSFTIDEKINATNIEANYVNGVLTLNLPKNEPVKASIKEIAIK